MAYSKCDCICCGRKIELTASKCKYCKAEQGEQVMRERKATLYRNKNAQKKGCRSDQPSALLDKDYFENRRNEKENKKLIRQHRVNSVAEGMATIYFASRIIDDFKDK